MTLWMCDGNACWQVWPWGWVLAECGVRALQLRGELLSHWRGCLKVTEQLLLLQQLQLLETGARQRPARHANCLLVLACAWRIPHQQCLTHVVVAGSPLRRHLSILDAERTDQQWYSSQSKTIHTSNIRTHDYINPCTPRSSQFRLCSFPPSS